MRNLRSHKGCVRSGAEWDSGLTDSGAEAAERALLPPPNASFFPSSILGSTSISKTGLVGANFGFSCPAARSARLVSCFVPGVESSSSDRGTGYKVVTELRSSFLVRSRNRFAAEKGEPPSSQSKDVTANRARRVSTGVVTLSLRTDYAELSGMAIKTCFCNAFPCNAPGSLNGRVCPIFLIFRAR